MVRAEHGSHAPDLLTGAAGAGPVRVRRGCGRDFAGHAVPGMLSGPTTATDVSGAREPLTSAEVTGRTVTRV
ncbi:hypothetical protein CTKZ_20450 [Cellulomonas algicola]|uniref:Uncharacterized protein n=1 Tax=Cellulomonas algicola TaxID=2071633 RepID=A0A401V0Q3_9CELL|nr:hypothetical protein CTKZ_20450 [Cellulomonas algicola]